MEQCCCAQPRTYRYDTLGRMHACPLMHNPSPHAPDIQLPHDLLVLRQQLLKLRLRLLVAVGSALQFQTPTAKVIALLPQGVHVGLQNSEHVGQHISAVLSAHHRMHDQGIRQHTAR